MYSTKDNNIIGTYLRELYLENVSSDQAVFQRLIMRFLQNHAVAHLRRIWDDPAKYDDRQQLEMLFKFHADHMAFSYGNPAPASYLERRFKELKKIRFVTLGPDNKPNGQIVQSSVDKLPELIRKYPYVKHIIQLKKGELLQFRSIAGAFFSGEINEYIELLSNIKDSWFFGTSQKQLISAGAEIEERIKKFAAVEEFLEKTEIENLSPFQVFPYEFFVEKEHRNAAVPASILLKLEEVEKSYLR